jgi:tellurite resistance protein TerC
MTIWLWIGFTALVLFLLALDLGVFNRTAHVVSTGEAFGWTALWVALALLFNVGIYYIYDQHWLGVGLDIGHPLGGSQAALQFFTGYLIEKSLSLDNIFVIALIFTYFGVPLRHQHRLLFWGILGALVLRGVMIVAGVALINRFSWMVYVFGGLLILTAVKMLVARHDNLEPDRNPLVRLARRVYPVSAELEDGRFFTRTGGRRAVTPMLLALLVIESTDVLFAVDSIPAIFAVTRDPFIVFTSNIFAILGLRSLYFVLASAMQHFRYLKMSLVFILAFVGVKMILAHHHPIPTAVSLAVIAGILVVGVLASIVPGHTDTAALVSPLAEEMEELVRPTVRRARRIVILVAGTTVVLFGTALLVLPGPGLLVIFAGLAILASEFIWARRLLRRVRTESEKLAEMTKRTLGIGG